MYEAVTRDVRVRVEPTYDPERSNPESHRFFWLYEIEILNEGTDVVRLITRHWQITDAAGTREDVRGPGVVGKMPIIEPGNSFTYTSGCPLSTPSGIMAGSYEMALPDGETFEVEIPAFSLDSPNAKPTVN